MSQQELSAATIQNLKAYLTTLSNQKCGHIRWLRNENDSFKNQY